jgi:hypothetical protein
VSRSAFERLRDRPNDDVDLMDDVLVPEAKDADAESSENAIALLVDVGSAIVNAAVHFDDKAPRRGFNTSQPSRSVDHPIATPLRSSAARGCLSVGDAGPDGSRSPRPGRRRSESNVLAGRGAGGVGCRKVGRAPQAKLLTAMGPGGWGEGKAAKRRTRNY